MLPCTPLLWIFDTFRAAQYNSFRALLIIAIIVLAGSIACVVLGHAYPQSTGWRWAAEAASVFAAVCVLISWSLIVAHFGAVWQAQVYSDGPAFKLIIAAWVFMVIQCVLYPVTLWADKEGYVKDGKPLS